MGGVQRPRDKSLLPPYPGNMMMRWCDVSNREGSEPVPLDSPQEASQPEARSLLWASGPKRLPPKLSTSCRSSLSCGSPAARAFAPSGPQHDRMRLWAERIQCDLLSAGVRVLPDHEGKISQIQRGTILQRHLQQKFEAGMRSLEL